MIVYSVANYCLHTKTFDTCRYYHLQLDCVRDLVIFYIIMLQCRFAGFVLINNIKEIGSDIQSHARCFWLFKTVYYIHICTLEFCMAKKSINMNIGVIYMYV